MVQSVLHLSMGKRATVHGPYTLNETCFHKSYVRVALKILMRTLEALVFCMHHLTD